jgi:hypothetical protein
MTGYLRSLAAHGITPGPRLRPIAVPFVRSALSTTPQELQQIVAEIPTPASTAPSQQPDTFAPRVSVADAGADDTVRRAPLNLAEAIVRLTDPPKRSREPQPSAPRAPERSAAPSLLPEAPASPSVRTPPARADIASPPSYQPRDRSSAPANQARVTPIPVAAPGTTPAVPSRITERRNDSARNRQESAPDVHIHIGRIELTAVAPPAPPRRQQAAARAAMPLDEYLQRRNGRAR